MPLPHPRAWWLSGRGEGFDYSALALSLSLALALALAMDVQQFNRCQIARSIFYCSIIIVGPSEEAKSPSARFTRVRTIEPPEEAKSQAQGFIGVVILVGAYFNYSE